MGSAEAGTSVLWSGEWVTEEADGEPVWTEPAVKDSGKQASKDQAQVGFTRAVRVGDQRSRGATPVLMPSRRDRKRSAFGPSLCPQSHDYLWLRSARILDSQEPRASQSLECIRPHQSRGAGMSVSLRTAVSSARHQRRGRVARPHRKRSFCSRNAIRMSSTSHLNAGTFGEDASGKVQVRPECRPAPSVAPPHVGRSLSGYSGPRRHDADCVQR